jgi:UPF0755 protein
MTSFNIRPYIALFFFMLAIFYAAVQPSFIADSDPVLVKIERGASAHEIARILEQKDVIASKKFFQILAQVRGKSKAFKPGAYKFERNHYLKILRALEQGENYTVKITIPEGWTGFQIAERLKEKGIITDILPFMNLVIRNGAEGMLFPDTYFLEPFSEPGEVIGRMVSEYRKNFTDVMAKKAAVLKLPPLQAVTLASIVEREARTDAERPIIASVYLNRLKSGWKLDADPTVQYAVSNGRSWPKDLSKKDLGVDSPYNTYKRRGLPPGPICNPGVRSLQAAVDPAQTRYFFFVAQEDGTHYFSSRLEDHLRKISELRRERRNRER